jgi:hypothetical protein
MGKRLVAAVAQDDGARPPRAHYLPPIRVRTYIIRGVACEPAAQAERAECRLGQPCGTPRMGLREPYDTVVWLTPVGMTLNMAMYESSGARTYPYFDQMGCE